jgi:endogenous inhibitor of DNA gyrase (YacG/DUF329 family)
LKFSNLSSEMPRKRVSLRCPTCKKLVLRNDPEFPFCSERCRVIDLGKWASGGYVISTPIIDPEGAGLEYRPNPGEDNAAQGDGAKGSSGIHSKRRH